MGVTLKKRKLSDGRYTLYLDIYQNGKRKFEFLDFKLNGDSKDKELFEMAKSLRAKRELELASDIYDIPSFKKKIDYYQYADSHIKHLSPNTLVTFKNMHVFLKEFADDNLNLNQINVSFCQRFVQFLLKKVKPNSAITYFAKLKTILNHAVNEGIISKNPARGIKIRGTTTLPKYLTIAELHKLSETHCDNEESKLIFFFACFTGLRWSDLITLTWGQINFQEKTIMIREQKTGHIHIEPLTPQAVLILNNLWNSADRNGSNLVFSKLPLHQVVNRYLCRWGKKAIDKGFTIHAGRHTFATLLLTSGVDLYIVSKLLGHKNLKNTIIYASIIDEKKIEAVEQLRVHTVLMLNN